MLAFWSVYTQSFLTEQRRGAEHLVLGTSHLWTIGQNMVWWKEQAFGVSRPWFTLLLTDSVTLERLLSFSELGSNIPPGGWCELDVTGPSVSARGGGHFAPPSGLLPDFSPSWTIPQGLQRHLRTLLTTLLMITDGTKGCAM